MFLLYFNIINTDLVILFVYVNNCIPGKSEIYILLFTVYRWRLCCRVPKILFRGIPVFCSSPCCPCQPSWKFPLSALQRNNTENSKQIFLDTELRDHSPNFHIHVSVSDLYIPLIDLPILLQENRLTNPRNIVAHRHMNVEIVTETAQFPEKEYINGIFIAVWSG
jgi:hypothetical protein